MAILVAAGLGATMRLDRMVLWVVPAAGLQQFLGDFVGGPAVAWKEVVLAVLVARALGKATPRFGELLALVAALWIFSMYAALGAPINSTLWGAKLLLQYAVLSWAVYSLAEPSRDWLAMFAGFAVLVAMTAVLVLWQSAQGVSGLLSLGLEYGKSVREANGSLREFGGFSYSAPMTYAMALAGLTWVSLAVRNFAAAMATIWVPALALACMVLASGRTALVGFGLGLLVLAWRSRRGISVGLIAALLLGATVLGTSGSSRDFLAEGVTLRSDSFGARQANWSERAATLRVFGHGPGSAGVAIERTQGNAAVATDDASSGVVDNQYLGFLYQYGLLGVLLIGAAAFLIVRAAGERNALPSLSAAGFGAFAIVAASSVNIWEEFPINMYLAIAVALGLRQRQLAGSGTPSEAIRTSTESVIESPRWLRT